jgi:hypothetical protein
VSTIVWRWTAVTKYHHGVLFCLCPTTSFSFVSRNEILKVEGGKESEEGKNRARNEREE